MPFLNSLRSPPSHQISPSPLQKDVSSSNEKTIAEDVEPALSTMDPIEIAKKKKLIRRVDLQIIPMIMLLYCFSFLDRVNIGNARLMGLEEDLNLTGTRYQTAVSLFFVTYCLCEVPSNLLIKRLRPNRYLPFITVSWGIIATSMGAVQTYTGLIITRLLLGIVESGLLPGLIIYLTLFYTRRQLALRTAFLFIASACAGVLGGMIAYGVTFLDHHHNIRAWRYLFLIEGSPTILLGIICYFVLPESPEKAHFLSPAERALLIALRETEIGQNEQARQFNWADVRAAFKDWQIWCLSIASFGFGVLVYGFSTFMPTIIHEIGDWNTAEANALTVPVYFLGVVVYLIMALYSDRQQSRGLPSAIFCVIAVVGVSMLIAHKSAGVSYAGLFIVAGGMYTANGLAIAWLPSNKPRWAKRAVAVALHGGFANAAGVAMPWLFVARDAPGYTMGYAVMISLVMLSAVINASMSGYYRWVNRRREEGKEEWKVEGKSEEEVEMMGDESPRYVYTV